MTPPTRSRGATQSLATLVAVVATLVVVGVTWVFVGGVGGQVPESPTATVGVEPVNLGDGVARNDAVVLVHEQGDAVDRGLLRVTVGDDVVFVRTLSGEASGGVVADTNDDGRPDLYDPDGAAGVADEWHGAVTSGDRLVIRERDRAGSADVIERGETVSVVCVTENGGEVVLAEETV